MTMEQVKQWIKHLQTYSDKPYDEKLPSATFASKIEANNRSERPEEVATEKGESEYEGDEQDMTIYVSMDCWDKLTEDEKMEMLGKPIPPCAFREKLS